MHDLKQRKHQDNPKLRDTLQNKPPKFFKKKKVQVMEHKKTLIKGDMPTKCIMHCRTRLWIRISINILLKNFLL